MGDKLHKETLPRGKDSNRRSVRFLKYTTTPNEWRHEQMVWALYHDKLHQKGYENSNIPYLVGKKQGVEHLKK